MSHTSGYVVSPWKRTRFWAVTDRSGKLVAVTVYKKGAEAVKLLVERIESYSTGETRTEDTT